VSNIGIAEATEEREHAEDIASSAVSSLSAASSLVEAWQGGKLTGDKYSLSGCSTTGGGQETLPTARRRSGDLAERKSSICSI